MSNVAANIPVNPNSLQQCFRTSQPDVMATFGGSERLFQYWWRDIEQADPLDVEFVAEYSTNDKFLKNRLILPEEIPLLAIALVRAILQHGYQKVFFLERGAYPYLLIVQQLLAEIGRFDICCDAVRIKGLTRESFPCSLLTIAGTCEQDSQLLSQPLSKRSREKFVSCLEALDSSRANPVMQHLDNRGISLKNLLGESREVIINELSEIGLDSRILMPNVLKPVVFRAGNLLLQGSLTPQKLYQSIDDGLLSMSPHAQRVIKAMIKHSTSSDGQISLPAMLDYMNHYISLLKGRITHSVRPLLNVLLRDTKASTTVFNTGKTLFIDEVSICGSAYFALEAIGKSFNPRFKADFGAVSGMWENESFLDVAATSFFELKPLEDVPYLSPNYFRPIFSESSLQPIRPHRFPSCVAMARKVLRWERATYAETLGQSGRSNVVAQEVRRAEAEIVTAISAHMHWGDYPILQRRHECNPDVLPTLVTYYLGNFEVVEEQTWFRRDPVLEARLETVLGYCGRFQKPFYQEMDWLFSWLNKQESHNPGKFLQMRGRIATQQVYAHRHVLREVILAHELYQKRMSRGMDAIRQSLDEVRTFLLSKCNGTQDHVNFPILFHHLQGAIR